MCVLELALGISYSLLFVPPFTSLRTTVVEVYTTHSLSCFSVRYIPTCFFITSLTLDICTDTVYASCYELVCVLWTVYIGEVSIQ